MTRKSGTLAGIIFIALSVLAAAAGVLNYLTHHSRRGLAALVACGVFLIAGVILLILTSRALTG